MSSCKASNGFITGTVQSYADRQSVLQTSEMSYGRTGVEGMDLAEGKCHSRGWLKKPIKWPVLRYHTLKKKQNKEKDQTLQGENLKSTDCTV